MGTALFVAGAILQVAGLYAGVPPAVNGVCLVAIGLAMVLLW